jgi:P4 family phage/plasmid primase-like protien
MSQEGQGSMLDWALRYIRMGWPVFPCSGKVPRTENGLKDATLNEEQARSWWKQWPYANIGVTTGIRFFAFDVDVKGGGEDSYEFLKTQHGAFPDTAEQVTGTGGKHLLFRLPDFPVRNSAGMIAPGIDIRGAGGYIIVAPSVHPVTKREYFWDGLTEIEEQPIAAAPRWLLDKLRPGAANAVTGQTPKAQAVPASITEGGRNATMFKIACSLRRKGFSEEEILATLKVSNASRCQPPLDNDELQTIARSSARYTPDPRGNVFAGRPRGDVTGVEPPAAAEGGEGAAEIAVTVADVEAAIDAVIEAKDTVGAMRLAVEVAKLRPQFRAVIVAKLKQAFGGKFDLSEFKAAIKDAASATGGDGSRVPPQPPAGASEVPGGGIDLRWYPMTDAGNGERIVALFGPEIRYCIEMKKWLVWDGKRWAVDDMNVIRQKAKQMARLLFSQSLNNGPLEKHARASESFAAGTAALSYAATEPGIPISANELDQQMYLLNCPNGVVDLRSGELLPHNREFLITKLCPVHYDPKADCPKFKDFIEWAMGANRDAELTERTAQLVGFLQRAFGSALTSNVQDKALFVFYGLKGNNGKTTLLTLVRDLLGKDYSTQISIETIMTAAKNQDATMRADLADLRGIRFAVTSEVEKEHKLNSRLIKYLTGGMSEIKSCRKYENPIEFRASHHLFMDCNHRPRITDTDDAIWKRMKLVPFDVRISDDELDRELPDKLRVESSGVLAWMVRGCRVWLRDGLSDPPEVGDAGAEWRDHDDPLKEFVEDCCEVDDPDYFISAQDLAAGYEWWAKSAREKYPLGREAFNERLMSKGFKQSRGRRNQENKQYRAWEGIQLKAEVVAAIRKPGAVTGWIKD